MLRAYKAFTCERTCNACSCVFTHISTRQLTIPRPLHRRPPRPPRQAQPLHLRACVGGQQDPVLTDWLPAEEAASPAAARSLDLAASGASVEEPPGAFASAEASLTRRAARRLTLCHTALLEPAASRPPAAPPPAGCAHGPCVDCGTWQGTKAGSTVQMKILKGSRVSSDREKGLGCRSRLLLEGVAWARQCMHVSKAYACACVHRSYGVTGKKQLVHAPPMHFA